MKFDWNSDKATENVKKHGANAVWREITGKIRGRGMIWMDFMAHWNGIRHSPMQLEGKTYIGARYIKVGFDVYTNYVFLSVEGDTLRMVLMETHTGTIEAWREKQEKRTKRVQDFLDHVRLGKFTRNDYRELMGHERLKGAHMNEVFTPTEMRELLKGIEVYPSWKKKTQNEVH